jgi:hypothetical protein
MKNSFAKQGHPSYHGPLQELGPEGNIGFVGVTQLKYEVSYIIYPAKQNVYPLTWTIIIKIFKFITIFLTPDHILLIPNKFDNVLDVCSISLSGHSTYICSDRKVNLNKGFPKSLHGKDYWWSKPTGSMRRFH